MASEKGDFTIFSKLPKISKKISKIQSLTEYLGWPGVATPQTPPNSEMTPDWKPGPVIMVNFPYILPYLS